MTNLVKSARMVIDVAREGNGMTRVTATQAKTRFGEMAEKAQHEPVAVERSGRPYAVLISYEEYERLRALDDRYWLQRAEEARAGGYATHEEAMELIEGRLREGEP